jgi:hypothetical protein
LEKIYSGCPLIAIKGGIYYVFFLFTGDADILIIHLHLDSERTNEIIELLEFKNHLKELVTEMGFDNIRIKLLEEDRCLWKVSCLIHVICVCLCIVVSYTS